MSDKISKRELLLSAGRWVWFALLGGLVARSQFSADGREADLSGPQDFCRSCPALPQCGRREARAARGGFFDQKPLAQGAGKIRECPFGPSEKG